jgi:signal transduction histidine kinase
LGLPICKQLVEMHDGTIAVTSEESVGSNFYFTVPFADAELGEEDTAVAVEKLLDAVKRL